VRCPTRCVAPGTAARRADAAVIFKSKWSAAEMAAKSVDSIGRDDPSPAVDLR
jgi:hypothetical protein